MIKTLNTTTSMALSIYSHYQTSTQRM